MKEFQPLGNGVPDGFFLMGKNEIVQWVNTRMNQFPKRQDERSNFHEGIYIPVFRGDAGGTQ